MLRALSLCVAWFVIACTGSSGSDASTCPGPFDAGVLDVPQGNPITIRFAAMVGALPFACEQTYSGLGTSDSMWQPVDFRLYVHDFEMVGADGTSTPVNLTQDGLWQYLNVALLDFEDRADTCNIGTMQTNETVVGTVPSGSYVGMTFDIGVPFELDHQDLAIAPSPLNVDALFWGWESGYKFLAIDGNTGAMPPLSTFHIHLGSGGCVSDACGQVNTQCAQPNVVDVSLMPFDASTQTVVFDLAALVAGSDLSADFTDQTPGCMSDLSNPACPAIFARLGLPYGGTAAPGPQSFVHAQ